MTTRIPNWLYIADVNSLMALVPRLANMPVQGDQLILSC